MYNKENLEKKTKAELVKIALELQNHIDALEEVLESKNKELAEWNCERERLSSKNVSYMGDFQTTETLDADSIYKDRVTSDTGRQTGEILGRER